MGPPENHSGFLILLTHKQSEPATVTPGNLPQHPQQLPVANMVKAERVADHPRRPRNTSARDCDCVAQREFIRNNPATPEAMSPIESCGVADKTSIFGAARRGVGRQLFDLRRERPVPG